MRYRDVTLTDFGIYQNARIEELPAGLGVIAGPQRAGKTTFMEALRHLPFGINRGDDLPPASHEHDLGATVVHDTGEHSIRVTGEAAPRIGSIDATSEVTQSELTGGVSKRQYQHLFTLSLRELQQVPDGLGDTDDFSEILLGAAYGDISDIPRLRDDLSREARTIGGKRGRASYELGPVVDRIEDAVSERAAAKQTVAQYEAQHADLDQIETEIEELASDEAELEAEETRLSILEKWFDAIERHRELRAERSTLREPTHEFRDDASETAVELGSDLHDAVARVSAARRALARCTDADDIDAHAQRLQEAAPTIEHLDRQVEKWRAQDQALSDTEQSLEDDQEDLLRRVAALRSDWSTLDDVRAATVDSLTRETVRERTTRVERLTDELEDTQQELVAVERELEALEADLEDAESEVETRVSERGSTSTAPLVGAGVALLALVVGVGVGSVTTALVGYVIVAVGIIAGFLFTWTRIQSDHAEVDVEPVRELRAAISTRESTRAGLESERSTLKDSLEEAEEDLAELRATFELPRDASPAGIRAFHDSFQELRSEVLAHDQSREQFRAAQAEFEDAMTAAATELDDLVALDWDSKAPRANTEAVYAAIETATEAVEAAEDVAAATASLTAVRADAIELLTPWYGDDGTADTDLEQLATAEVIEELEAFANAASTAARYRELEAELEGIEAQVQREFDRSTVIEAFRPVQAALDEAATTAGVAGDGGEDATQVHAIALLDQLAEQYPTGDAIGDRRREIEASLDSLQEEREMLRDERAEIKETLKTLASDADLRAAEAKIQRHRETLESLGREYAVNRLAETLLDELHDEFLEQATGPLLDEASDIFSRLTRTYDGVSHAGDLDSLEFEALLSDGGTRGPGRLSRATAEQLFLSIRLARIRQFDAALPVIIDDAMTNFDPAHTRRALAFLDELARTHQVLLLTCHPEVVAATADETDASHYWVLDDGQFRGPQADPATAIQFLETGE